MEIELKYSLDDENLAGKIELDEVLAKYKVKDSENEKELYAIYFDTKDGLLQNEMIAFRIRHEGNRNIATLKWGGMQDGALHKREELNINIGSGEFPSAPDISVFSQSEIGQKLMDIIGDEQLVPMMEIKMIRKSWRLSDDNEIVEFSIDRGQVITINGIEEINEIEIELLVGKSDRLMELGQMISDKYMLKPEKRSKYERGLALLKR